MVTCVITARPSYPRIQSAIEALRLQTEVRLIAAGAACDAKHGAVVDQMRADGWTPDVLPGLWSDNHPSGMAQMIGHLAITLATEFRRVPSPVIVVADRHETLAVSLAAATSGLPLIHVQGGEVSGNIDDKIRKANSALADLHLVATAAAGLRVRSMGVRGPVHVTGCPSIDLVHRTPTEQRAVVLPGVGPSVDTTAPFVLALQHPHTPDWLDSAAHTERMASVLLRAGLPIVWFRPNHDAGWLGTQAMLEGLHESGAPIRLVHHVPPEDFIRLLRSCAVAVGNSSAFVREGSALGTPVILVGDRQSGREFGPNVIAHVPNPMSRIWPEIPTTRRNRPVSSLYGSGDAGRRIAHSILERYPECLQS